jgi:hypothetical protein
MPWFLNRLGAYTTLLYTDLGRYTR